MTGTEIRTKLHGGDRVYGTLIVSPSPRWVDTVAALGLDFVFIDTEHVSLDRESVSMMCKAYDGTGLAPVVRIPSPDPYEACKALDGGAAGIIAPYVETPEQVRDLVGAVKWRPVKGKKLERFLDGHADLEPGLKRHLEERNAGNFLIVNIESVPAIEQLDRIVRVPGLDAVLVGPHDLSCSLGIPGDYPNSRFVDAVETIIATARAAGIGAGVHVFYTQDWGMEQEIRFIEKGANLVVHGTDLEMFAITMKRDMEKLRRMFSDGATARFGRSREI